VDAPKVYAGPGQREVRLECSVFGEPSPEVSEKQTRLRSSLRTHRDVQVRWQHTTNNRRPSTSDPTQRLFASTEGKRATLVVRDVEETDYGFYECVAENSVGVEVARVELTGEKGERREEVLRRSVGPFGNGERGGISSSPFLAGG